MEDCLDDDPKDRDAQGNPPSLVYSSDDDFQDANTHLEDDTLHRTLHDDETDSWSPPKAGTPSDEVNRQLQALETLRMSTAPHPHGPQRSRSVGHFHSTAVSRRSGAAVRSTAVSLSRDCPNKTGADPILRRLRSSSGLDGHFDPGALRQYTDYDEEGRLPSESPKADANDPKPLDSEDQPRKILDVYGGKIQEAIVQNPATFQALRDYAVSRGWTQEVHFLHLLKQYNERLEEWAAILTRMSSVLLDSEGGTALQLPPGTYHTLKKDLDSLCTSMAPSLRLLFSQETIWMQDRLMASVYPKLLRSAICHSLEQAVDGSGMAQPLIAAGTSGFGQAFCMTDSTKPDNPMEFISPGLTGLIRMHPRQMYNANPRIFQGHSKQGRRLSCFRRAMLDKMEHSDIVLNHWHDQSQRHLSSDHSQVPFWNLVWTVPLLDQDGSVRYYLGGQINVTSLISIENDILRLLGDYHEAMGEPQPEFRQKRRTQRSSESGQQDDGHGRSRSSSRMKAGLDLLRRAKRSLCFPELPNTSDRHTILPDKVGVSEVVFSTSSRLNASPIMVPYRYWLVLEILTPGGRRGKVSEQTVANIDKLYFTMGLAYWSAFCTADLFETTEPELRAQVGKHDIFQLLSNFTGVSSPTKDYGLVIKRDIAEGCTSIVDMSFGAPHRWRRSPARSRSRTLVPVEPGEVTTTVRVTSEPVKDDSDVKRHSSLRRGRRLQKPPVSFRGPTFATAEVSPPARSSSRKGLSPGQRHSQSRSPNRSGRRGSKRDGSGKREFRTYWSPMNDSREVPRYVVVILAEKKRGRGS